MPYISGYALWGAIFVISLSEFFPIQNSYSTTVNCLPVDRTIYMTVIVTDGITHTFSNCYNLMQPITFLHLAKYYIVCTDYAFIIYRLNHNRLSRFNDRGQAFSVDLDNTWTLMFGKPACSFGGFISSVHQ